MKRSLCILLNDELKGSPKLSDDILRRRVLPALGLDERRYFPTFMQLRDYWGEKVHGSETYILCAALQLGKILKTPDEWLKVGRHLADATANVYGNGSHQLVEDAVPSLIEGGLIDTPDDLVRGIDILVDIPTQLKRNGADVYEQIAHLVITGRCKSLEHLSRDGRPTFLRYLHTLVEFLRKPFYN